MAWFQKLLTVYKPENLPDGRLFYRLVEILKQAKQKVDANAGRETVRDKICHHHKK